MFVSLTASSSNYTYPTARKPKLTLSRIKISALHFAAAYHSGTASRTIEALYDDAPIALRTNTGNKQGGAPLNWA